MTRGAQAQSEQEEVRPVVWLFALICVGACALTVYLVAGASDLDDGPEIVRVDQSNSVARGDTRRRWTADGPSSHGPRTYDPALDPALMHHTDEADPQMAAMDRWSGPVDGGVPFHFNPTTSRGEIATIEGLPLSPGTACNVRILPIRTGGFSCMIRVMCDGLVLYPDPSQGAGYVDCDVEDGRPTSAIDDGFTFADGDPTVHFDRQRHRVTISDDGPGVPHFRAEIELSGPRWM
ncbi:MAG: hypothetical protein JRH11_15910 [Deltaproteobacteria bacterium]|nr:hypothetical protein [Deltaproteobacteria bacterium]